MPRPTIQIIVPKTDSDELSSGLRRLVRAIGDKAPDDVCHGLLGGDDGYGANIETDVFVMSPQYWGDCTCGRCEEDEKWCNENPHKPDCYWVLQDDYPNKAALEHAREAALQKRNELPWSGKAYDAAQAAVDRACSANDKAHQEHRRALCQRFDIAWDDGRGSAVHCTCDFREAFADWLKSKGWAELGHSADCKVVLPNFVYKPTNFTVDWYKWIGRDTTVRSGAVDSIYRMVEHCIASLSPKN